MATDVVGGNIVLSIGIMGQLVLMVMAVVTVQRNSGTFITALVQFQGGFMFICALPTFSKDNISND